MSKLLQFASASLLFFLFAPAANAAVDPDMLGKLKKGQTSAEVKEILGSPMSENKNPDGRYVYVYEWQEKADASKQGYATLLFGKDSKLIKLQAYERTGSK